MCGRCRGDFVKCLSLSENVSLGESHSDYTQIDAVIKIGHIGVER